MTAKLKFLAKASPSADRGFGVVADDLYNAPGCHALALIEFQHVDHNDPDEAAGIPRQVTLKMVNAEVARDEKRADVLRRMLRAMYVLRTADGTLDGDNDIHAANAELMRSVDSYAVETAAELRVVLTAVRGMLNDAVGGRQPLIDLKSAAFKAIAAIDKTIGRADDGE